MYERTARDLRDAQETALRVVADAGLTVLHGELPTDGQVGLAALHAREDAAMNAALLVKVLQRLEDRQGKMPQVYRLGTVFWWLGAILAVPTFGIALVIGFSVSYVLTGSFWKPPRRLS